MSCLDQRILIFHILILKFNQSNLLPNSHICNQHFSHNSTCNVFGRKFSVEYSFQKLNFKKNYGIHENQCPVECTKWLSLVSARVELLSPFHNLFTPSSSVFTKPIISLKIPYPSVSASLFSLLSSLPLTLPLSLLSLIIFLQLSSSALNKFSSICPSSSEFARPRPVFQSEMFFTSSNARGKRSLQFFERDEGPNQKK